jgi:hypothetical protein
MRRIWKRDLAKSDADPETKKAGVPPLGLRDGMPAFNCGATALECTVQ